MPRWQQTTRTHDCLFDILQGCRWGGEPASWLICQSARQSVRESLWSQLAISTRPSKLPLQMVSNKQRPRIMTVIRRGEHTGYRTSPVRLLMVFSPAYQHISIDRWWIYRPRVARNCLLNAFHSPHFPFPYANFPGESRPRCPGLGGGARWHAS